jgi:hypothetical protein
MKKKYGIPAVLIVISVLFLGACFSPWQGAEGTLTLSLGGGTDNSRILVNWKDEALRYEAILSGPDGIITRSFNGEKTVTLSAAPGEWEIAVRVYNGDERLRAMSVKSVSATVEAGKTTIAPPIELVTAAEVENWEQLQKAIGAGQNTSELSDSDSTRTEIVLIKKDLTAAETITPGKWNIILRSGDSEKPATITRGAGFTGALLGVNESKSALTIQNLVIDGSGGNVTAAAPLINVAMGKLTLENGAVLRNNKNGQGSGGGVSISGSAASFTMNGGTIEKNKAAGAFGGGVYVFGAGITCVMNGGEISGNEAATGGGVYLQGSGNTFTIKGGTITGNAVAAANGPDLGRSADSHFYDRNGKEMTDGVYVESGLPPPLPVSPSVQTAAEWNSALDNIKKSAELEHVIIITGDFELTSAQGNLNGGEFHNKHISLKGDNKTVTLSGNGNLLKIGSGLTVTIDGNITLDGGLFDKIANNNTDSLIHVENGGKLELNGGTITGNTTTHDGAGVYVDGELVMTGGAISGNRTSGWGGGVYVSPAGSFSKRGGTIYGATLTGGLNSNTAGLNLAQGNAVYVNSAASDGQGQKTLNDTLGPNDNVDA